MWNDMFHASYFGVSNGSSEGAGLDGAAPAGLSEGCQVSIFGTRIPII
jgi:hypothetical protein